MDFVTSLPVLTNWKGESYNSILVIVDLLTKIVYYKPVKVTVTIDIPGVVEVIIDIIMCNYGIFKSIVID